MTVYVIYDNWRDEPLVVARTKEQAFEYLRNFLRDSCTEKEIEEKIAHMTDEYWLGYSDYSIKTVSYLE